MSRIVFRYDGTPPGVNSMYHHVGTRLVLTEDARKFRTDFRLLARAAGFRFYSKKQYGVLLWLTFPTRRTDIDSCIKASLDAIFGARSDGCVYRLGVRKRVEPGVSRTTVAIIELRKT